MVAAHYLGKEKKIIREIGQIMEKNSLSEVDYGDESVYGKILKP